MQAPVWIQRSIRESNSRSANHRPSLMSDVVNSSAIRRIPEVGKQINNCQN